MDAAEFRKFGYQLIDWAADYLENNTDRPVMTKAAPGSIRNLLPDQAPEIPEEMNRILEDFRELIVPNLLHWNHPSFFGYFPANNSYPSILGELAAASVNVNAMNWATAPAATELEETVLDWIRQACGLPEHFRGVIHDAASTGAIAAVLAARERATKGRANKAGLVSEETTLTAYASAEAHSSGEKAIKIAGLGRDNLRLIPGDDNLGLDPKALAEAIEADRLAGRKPAIVVATVGSTNTTALDPLRPIGEIARREGLFFHVDAALAGTAALLPEKRSLFDGLELADSYVFNPHKWLFTNIDCSLQYISDPDEWVRVFAILPEYLKTDQDGAATNFRDWGVGLGRRFRGLKLWFVLREMGLRGIRNKLRAHLTWAQELAAWVEAEPGFELTGPVPLQTVCFTWRPAGVDDQAEINRMNEELVRRINADGRIYLTYSRVNDRGIVRVSIGQTTQVRDDVVRAWEVIREIAADMGED